MGNACCCDFDHEAERERENNERRVSFWKNRIKGRLKKNKEDTPVLAIVDRDNKCDDEFDSNDEVCL